MTVIERDHFYGRVHRLAHVGKTTISVTSYTGGAAVPEHAHDAALLCFVAKGFVQERTDGTRRAFPAGTLFFHPSGLPHAHRFPAAPTGLLTIQLPRVWSASAHSGGVELPVDPVHVRRTGLLDVARRLESLAAAGQSADELAADELIAQLLHTLWHADRTTASAARARWLRAVREILDARFRQPPSLVELAALAGVHAVHLSRAFHAEFGCTITEHVRRVRVARARDALKDGEQSVGAIALELGFADHAHFTRSFKAATGQTPAHYRSRLPSSMTASRGEGQS